MQISYHWLKQYLAVETDPDQLAALLTDCGLEVESVDKYQAIKGGLEGVVTGHVLTSEKHPDADKLTLNSVDVGQEEPLSIVCGAPNVAAGQKVLVALVGATLYLPGGELQIKKAKIRGQLSEGMICAEDELGLGDSHEGIMVLPDDVEPGMPAAEYFNLITDYVFEIGLTPNRIDAASHIGVARDVLAVLNHHTRTRDYSLVWPDISKFAIDSRELVIPVSIEDPEACLRYSSLTISGVKVEESPDWLKHRLLAVGQKPINNVVDVTNYVLQEMGQPLHAFDAGAIKGKKVVVRKPGQGTVFETLDMEKLELTGDDLMICDESEPMCMGGILGGTGSGVTHKTNDVFLESACFDPVSIRKSSRIHGLKTEASFRFERGSDPHITVKALKRAALLIKELAGGKISSDISDLFPGKKNEVMIQLNYDHVDGLIGKHIPPETIRSVLEDLDFKVMEKTDKGLLLVVPAYRVDVTRPADVIEEILRIYGYNQVEVPSKMHASIVISPKPDKEKLQNVISDMLSARGFQEIMNNSLTKASYYHFQGFDQGQLVSIVNPLSQDLNVMRHSLLFGGLETIAFNQNRKLPDLKLFEFGNIYARDAVKDGEGPLTKYNERMVLGLFLTGMRQPESWSEKPSEIGFFDLKKAAMVVLERLGMRERQITLKPVAEDPLFTFGSDVLFGKKHMGRIGMLTDGVMRRFDIRKPVFYGYIEWDMLMKYAGEHHILYQEVPRFPEVRRDLALLLDAGIGFAEIERIAHETERKILCEVNLFDVYQDDRLGKDKKSYAVSYVFRDDQKTLRDKDVDKIMEKMQKAYQDKLGASIR